MPTDAVTIGAMLRDLTTTYLAWSNGTRELVAPTLSTPASSFNFYPGAAARDHLGRSTSAGASRTGSSTASSQLGARDRGHPHGLEYWYRNTLALRTGVNGKDLTFGAGLRYKQVGVDYAASLHRFFAQRRQQFPDDQTWTPPT